MSQHDYNIANQSFPSFRTDLNNALSAIQTCNSGTSRPSGAVAGQIWLDTTSATSPTLKYYDGADDISLATIDHSANTVNWLDSNVSVTGLTTTATGTVITLSDTANTSTVNLIIDNQKEVRFRETTANGTNYIGLKAPASVSADFTFTLPSADGTAGQFLKTDGAGNLSFDSLSFSTPLAVIGNATAGSEIRLPEDTDNGSNYVALKAPDTIASNLTLTLPSADGSSGQVLQTNGSGVLSFSSVPSDFVKLATSTISGSVSTISLDGYFSSTYKYYKLFISDFGVTSTYKSTFLRVRRSNADVTGSHYTYGYFGNATSGSISSTNTTNAIIGYEMEATSSQGRLYGELTFYNPSDTTSYKFITGVLTMWNPQFSVNGGISIRIGLKDSTSALSGFTIYTDGTFETGVGTITLYGIK